MGMSASQVRFLSLQNRKHTIGRELSTLSNRKMALSRDMNKVSKNYTQALNQIGLKWSGDSGATYQNLTYDLMMRPNELNTETPYIITNAKNGRVILNNDTIKACDVSNHGSSTAEILAKSTIKDVNGNDIITAGQPISYVSLAKLISNYSDVDKYSNLQFETDGVHTGTDGVLYGNKAVDNGYYIPDAVKDYNFSNTLRYEIFNQLGLVTENQVQRQESLLNALYGSKEAQEAEVYPVGSAWGDYYIAVANKEAYENFLSTKQKMAISNTQVANNTRNYRYASKDEDYIYNATVNSSDGHSDITFSLTDALEKVSFKAVTTTGSDGYFHTTYYTDTDWASVSANVYNSMNTNPNSTVNDFYASKGASGVDYTDVYRTSYSQNGIKYSFTLDDLTNKWLASEGGPTLSNAAGFAVRKGPEETRQYLVGDGGEHAGRHEYWLASNNVQGTISAAFSTPLDDLLNYTKNIILESGSFDTEAFNKAKNATIARFVNGFEDHDTDTCYTGRAAFNASNDVTYIEQNRQQWHWDFMFDWTDARWSAAVDMESVFNCFMTYYYEYAADTSGAPLVLTPNADGSNVPTLNEDVVGSKTAYYSFNSYTDSSVMPPKTYYSYIQGDKYKNRNYENIFSGKRVKLEASSYGSYIIGSDGKLTNEIPDGYTGKRYRLVDGLDRHGNIIADNFSYVTDTSLPSGETVWGTIVHNNEIYNFSSKSQVDKYINTGVFDTGSLQHAGSDSSTPAQDQKFGFDGAVDFNIVKSDSGSTYAIYLDSYVEESTTYTEYLDQKINEAKQRIENLQFELDNFYSGADKKIMDYYDALFLKIAESGWEVDEKTGDKNAHSAEYLNGMLQNNMYFVTTCREKVDSTGYQYTTQIASNVKKIFQVHDSNAENQALAVYESDKTLIQAKEKKIDARMRKLETEQEAINTEMDGIKKVISDNIDKTFKIFA